LSDAADEKNQDKDGADFHVGMIAQLRIESAPASLFYGNINKGFLNFRVGFRELLFIISVAAARALRPFRVPAPQAENG
jgi:hypothetical protein